LNLEEKKKKEKEKIFKNYNFGGTLKTQNLLLVALIEKSFTNAKFGLQHEVDTKTTFGVEFSHKLDKTQPFNVQVGLLRKIDESSSVKTKLLSSGLASASYEVKIREDLKATISLEASVKELSKDGKIGFELSFEPLD